LQYSIQKPVANNLRISQSTFPYTTLFRSLVAQLAQLLRRLVLQFQLLGDALHRRHPRRHRAAALEKGRHLFVRQLAAVAPFLERSEEQRLHTSHRTISYAVFSLKKKKRAI